MDEVDRYVPDPVRALDKPFAMPVEDVFSIQVGCLHVACLPNVLGCHLLHACVVQQPFLPCRVEGVFSIQEGCRLLWCAPHICRLVIHAHLQGRGTVVTGRVEQGIVKTGDEVEIVGIRPQNTKSTVTGERLGLRFWAGGPVAVLLPSW